MTTGAEASAHFLRRQRVHERIGLSRRRLGGMKRCDWESELIGALSSDGAQREDQEA